ncbi:MAG TPA: tripartite tricarboxylate transporter TctB family protein [Rhizobiaceae bacterium]
MSQAAATQRSRTDVYAEWAITSLLLIMFAGAFALSLKWSAQTAFLPRLLSGAGAVLVLVRIGGLLRSALSHRPVTRSAPAQVPAAPQAGADDEKVIELLADVDEEDQGNEDELKGVFSNSPLKLWVEALSWLTAFFVCFYLFGLLLVLPVFTVLYLRFIAKKSWPFCLLYVTGTAGLIYFLFIRLLHLPVPQGVFPLISL